MTTEQAIQGVAMIARNGIDRVIELERDKAKFANHCTRRLERDHARQGTQQHQAAVQQERPVSSASTTRTFTMPRPTGSAA